MAEFEPSLPHTPDREEKEEKEEKEGIRSRSRLLETADPAANKKWRASPHLPGEVSRLGRAGSIPPPHAVLPIPMNGTIDRVFQKRSKSIPNL